MEMKKCKRIQIMASSGIGLIGVILMILELFGVKCFALLNKLAFGAQGLRFFGLLFALVVIAVIACVHVNAFLIALRGEKTYKARMITLKGTKDDVVLIKQETLDAFVKTVVGEPAGVSEIKVDTGYQDMKLGVRLEVAMDIDADIRKTTDKMQEEVRNQLEIVNGIQLSGVSILINKINVPAISDGMSMPWAAKTEEEKKEEPKEEAAPAKEANEAFEAAEAIEEEEPFEPAPLLQEENEEK